MRFQYTSAARAIWIGAALLALASLTGCGVQDASAPSATGSRALASATAQPEATSAPPAPTATPQPAASAQPAAPTATPLPDVAANAGVTDQPNQQFLPVITQSAIWYPAPNSSWQWQLTGLPVDQSVDVAVYDIDLFDNDASVIAALHARGRRVICYMNAGAWENFRPDSAQFPDALKGKELDGWPGERWLDIRNLAALGPLIAARLDLCKAKGFDAVEPDNVDGYSNDSGFPLTAQDQLTYNTFLANAAHARGLSVGLKNDLDQVTALQPLFDWALNEQCFQYAECDMLTPFATAGKAVFQAEYKGPTSAFCPQAKAMHFSAMLKHLLLDAFREACS